MDLCRGLECSRKHRRQKYRLHRKQSNKKGERRLECNTAQTRLSGCVYLRGVLENLRENINLDESKGRENSELKNRSILYHPRTPSDGRQQRNLAHANLHLRLLPYAPANQESEAPSSNYSILLREPATYGNRKSRIPWRLAGGIGIGTPSALVH
jgi:hypothetical protein